MYYQTERINRVWYYDQMRAARKAKLPGFCAGMVVFWIMLRANDNDFDTFQRDRDTVAAELSPEQLQAIIQNQHSIMEVDGRGGYDQLLRTDGFQLKKKNTHRVGASEDAYEDLDLESVADFVARQARNNPTINVNQAVRATWFVVRLRPPKPDGGSGHAVAIEVRTDSEGQQVYRLMDPNNGCFEFYTRTKFKEWLMGQFFLLYRQLYTGYVKVIRVSRLDPPPLSKFTNKVKAVLKKVFK